MKKLMKTFIRWLAKVFKADITTVKTVTEYRYLPPEGGTVQGDLTVTGTLVVNGKLMATDDISCKLEAGKEEENGNI